VPTNPTGSSTTPPIRHHTSVDEVARSRQNQGTWQAHCSCDWTAIDPRKTDLDAWVDARNHITRIAGWDPIKDDTCESCRQGGQMTYLDLRDRCLGLYWLHRDCARTWRRWGMEGAHPAYSSRYFARVQAFHLGGEHEPTDRNWTARDRNCPLCYEEAEADPAMAVENSEARTRAGARGSGGRSARTKRASMRKHLATARGFHEVALGAREGKHYEAAMLNALYAAIGAANAVSVLVVSPGSKEPADTRLAELFKYEALWSGSSATRSLLRLVVDAPLGLAGGASRVDANDAIRGAEDVIRWAGEAIEQDENRAALSKRPLERPKSWIPRRAQSGKTSS
jgi:hypothetical protein